MKKSIAIILFAGGLLHFQVHAQRFMAGISAGFVGTDVYNSDLYDYDNDFHKAGFLVGGAVSAPLSERVTIRFEMNYIQKGTQQPSDSLGNGFYKFSFNYLEFPLMLKYRLRFNVKKNPVKGFDLHAGISLGRLMTSKAEGDNFYSNNDDTYLNKTDISLLAGLGYNINEHWNFTFRYSQSLGSVFKQNTAAPVLFGATFKNGNNMVAHFILQYTFGFNKNIAPPPDENSN
jgi:opacity protein-like surface antigen